MNQVNRELLEEVIENRLEIAKEYESKSEVSKMALKEAMDAIDRSIELSKMEEESIEKKESSKINTMIKVVEIGAALLLAPLIEYCVKSAFADRICNFEKDYTFTSSAGKSLSGFFRFKK